MSAACAPAAVEPEAPAHPAPPEPAASRPRPEPPADHAPARAAPVAEAPPAGDAAPDADAKRAPLRPAHAGATRYAASPSARDRAAVRRDSLRAGLVKDARALARKVGRRAPKPDARLDEAMNDLARNLGEDDLPANEVLDFLLTHYGVVDPSPNLLISRGTAGADREIRQQARTQIADVLKTGPVERIGIGVARAGDLMCVVIGLQVTHVAIAPVPRRVARGARVTIEGKLPGRYRGARVVVTAPDGKVTEQDPSSHAGRFHGRVGCDAAGKYEVEVTADDVNGTAVLANFPVYCGVEPPVLAPGAAGMRQSRVNADAAEKVVLALVNRDRAATGVPPVAWDERLAEVARAHSRDMAEHDFVAHVSPRTGTVLDRVHKAGLGPSLILENVGRTYSAEEAESGFMASPGHRANVVDPKVTRIGVGVALGKAVTGTIPLYVTQVLTD